MSVFDADIPLWALEDIEELQELAGRVRQLTDRYQNALVGTLNRTAAGARTDAVSMVKAAYNLLPADVKRVRKRFRYRRATFRHPVAHLWAKDAHGVHISERQPYAAWEGIKFNVLHGRALLSGPGAFIAHGQHSDKIIVFRRRRGLVAGRRGRPVQDRKIEAKFTTSEMTFLSGQGRKELLGKVQVRLARDGRDQLDYHLRRIFDKKWGVRRSRA